MYLTWLPDVLRASGVPVHVLPGAAKRSTTRAGLSHVNGVVWHDTVTSQAWTNQAVRQLLRDGHTDLRGPLSQVGIERDGLWVIVALGRCSHNGYGLWGNDAIGLEMYNAGANVGERNPPGQVESALTGTVAILRHLRMNAERVKGHKETDPNRKVDPHHLDMGDIRRRISDRLTIPGHTTTEDDMDWTSLMEAAFRAKKGPDLDAERWGKVWYWGDVLVRKAVEGDDPWGGYQWIKAHETDLR